MSVTLKQIADMAGVHKSTVDKVIHDRPGVSDKTRAKIRSLLKEYGYEANPLGKALNYQKKKLKIAVVLPIVDAINELKHGMEYVHQDFHSFNCEILYYEIPYHDVTAQAKCLYNLIDEGVSGIILSAMEDQSLYDVLVDLEKAHIPVITVNSDLEDAPRLCFVGQNIGQAGKVAARIMKTLISENGKLAVLSSHDSLRSVEQRERAFKRHLNYLNADLQIVDTLDTKEDPRLAYEITANLLSNNPDLDALYITCGCVSDICKAVRDSGKSGQLTIICYERYPEIKELVKNGEIACTISGDLSEQGRIAMRLLFEYMIFDKIPENELYYTQSSILIAENI